MNEYKVEMHAHTSQTSNCAKVGAADLIEAYINAGYDTVVITDHMSTHTYYRFKQHLSWDKKVDIFMKGYNTAKAAANGRINVLLGMELRFDTNTSENDYLVYGITEEFLRKNHRLLNMKISEFSKIAKKNNFLIYQAHPFRVGMKVTNPEYLNGVEVNNGCVRHNSNNKVAQIWAEENNLKMISGSDYHQIGDEAKGGIIVHKNITNNEDLLSALNENNYSLIIN